MPFVERTNFDDFFYTAIIIVKNMALHESGSLFGLGNLYFEIGQVEKTLIIKSVLSLENVYFENMFKHTLHLALQWVC